MDRERFGRALGQGAREAAKTLLKAADAAAAPNPRVTRTAGAVVGRAVLQAKDSSAGVKRGGKRFGEAVWGPFVKLSGVLWLELTGVFFGLFALTASIEIWRHHSDFRAGGDAGRHVWFAVAMLGVFGYFTVTSFLRAARRGRSK